jgi:ribosomal protein S18 acetylase RimI-like enzyme
MTLTELSNAADFLAATVSMLMESEAENNLLLSSALTLARSSSGRLPKLSFFVVKNASGRAICSALNVCDRRLLVSTASLEGAHFLGEELARRGVPVRAVLGPSDVTVAFREGAQKTGGASLTPHQHLLQRRLHAKNSAILRAAPAAAPGLWRTAKEKDLKLLLKWSKQFVDESGHDEPIQETEEVVRRYLENKQLFIWEDEKPVAMAGYGGFTPNGARINMVYTEPKARSKGYAKSLVSAIGRKLLSSGRYQFCFLFVTEENQPANRVYEQLGYEKIGSFSELRPAQV